MTLSIYDLEKIQGLEKLGKVEKQALDILLAAINDWPNPISNLDDFENELIKLLGSKIDKKAIEDYLLKIDYSKNAWIAESISQLIELYDLYKKHKFLNEIIEKIKEELQIYVSG